VQAARERTVIQPINGITTIKTPSPKHLRAGFSGFRFYKWIEAVGYILQTEPDSELEALADGAIDLISSAQEADGYINTHYTINNPLKRLPTCATIMSFTASAILPEAASELLQRNGQGQAAQCRLQICRPDLQHFR
jgi:DUF1680 family protein